MKKFIKEGFDINIMDNRGNIALSISAENGRIEAAKLLIQYGGKYLLFTRGMI